MKIKEESVKPSEFKRVLDIKGVPDLHTAINVLQLYQEWRTNATGKSLDDIGLSPHLITAALHYVLNKFHSKQIYHCMYCKYINEEGNCMCRNNECHYERVKQ